MQWVVMLGDQVYTHPGWMEKQRKVKYHIWRCKKCRSSDDLGRKKDAVLGKATRRTQRRTFAFASRPTHGCMWRGWKHGESARQPSLQWLIYRMILNIRSKYSTISSTFLNLYISKLAPSILSLSRWENGEIIFGEAFYLGIHNNKNSVSGDFSHCVG